MSVDDTPQPQKPKAKRPLTPAQKAEVAAAPYEQGFGKPPKTSQFTKGVSGNPSGRPKEARAMRTDLLAVLDLQVQVQLPDGPQKVSLQRAMILALGAKAAKGDVRAIAAILRLMELATPERLKEVNDGAQLNPAEQAQMEMLLINFGLGAEALSDVLADHAAPPQGGPANETENDEYIGFEI